MTTPQGHTETYCWRWWDLDRNVFYVEIEWNSCVGMISA